MRTPWVSLDYPSSTPSPPVVPPRVPPTTPLDRVRPRTSVGARPHVVVPSDGAGVAPAADDVDGAGGVDHGRVPISRSPRRGHRTASPHGTCTHASTHTRACARTHGGARTHARTQSHARTHARTHAHARAHTRTHTHKRRPPSIHAHEGHRDSSGAHAPTAAAHVQPSSAHGAVPPRTVGARIGLRIGPSL